MVRVHWSSLMIIARLHKMIYSITFQMLLIDYYDIFNKREPIWKREMEKFIIEKCLCFDAMLKQITKKWEPLKNSKTFWEIRKIIHSSDEPSKYFTYLFSRYSSPFKTILSRKFFRLIFFVFFCWRFCDFLRCC